MRPGNALKEAIKSMDDLSRQLRDNTDRKVEGLIARYQQGMDFDSLLADMGMVDTSYDRRILTQSIERLKKEKRVIQASGLYRLPARLVTAG